MLGYAETAANDTPAALSRIQQFHSPLQFHCSLTLIILGYIRYEKFVPVMTHVLMERRYKPATEEQMLRAFEVLWKVQPNSLLQANYPKIHIKNCFFTQ